MRPDWSTRDAVRAELGVADDDRLVVLSGTWGPIYRQFHYPIALAGLFDRPLERVHLVVKLHPGERDEGPYRAVVEGVAAARGFAPPPITVVRDVDLYRLLAAADAHLGPPVDGADRGGRDGDAQPAAATALAADLLGYVEAGVAIPVGTAEDLPAALDAARPRPDAPRRAAFLEAHFEPGEASQRIAEDLLTWLA